MEFLGSKAPIKILEFFCKNPSKKVYSKKIGKKLNISKATTIKWLKKLRDLNILSERKKGRKKYYTIRLGNPIAKQMRVLLTLVELIPPLKEISNLRSVYLIGPSARGTSAPNSPINLLILHRTNVKRINKVLKEVSEKINRKIKAKIMTPLQYAEMAKNKPKEHERIEREKIRVFIQKKR